MATRRSNLLLIWIGSIVVSVVAIVGSRFISQAACSPGHFDGQCAMSAYYFSLYGIAAGIVIFLCVSVYVLIAAFQRRRSSGSPASRV